MKLPDRDPNVERVIKELREYQREVERTASAAKVFDRPVAANPFDRPVDAKRLFDRPAVANAFAKYGSRTLPTVLIMPVPRPPSDKDE